MEAVDCGAGELYCSIQIPVSIILSTPLDSHMKEGFIARPLGKTALDLSRCT